MKTTIIKICAILVPVVIYNIIIHFIIVYLIDKNSITHQLSFELRAIFMLFILIGVCFIEYLEKIFKYSR